MMQSTSPDAIHAYALFKQLGIHFLSGTLNHYVRTILSAGMLTPLIKEEGSVDVRPVRAEDADTMIWCKAFARISAPLAKQHLIPHQLAVGTSAGVEMMINGFRMKVEEAVIRAENKIILKIDIANAHNTFSKNKCLEYIFALARSSPNTYQQRKYCIQSYRVSRLFICEILMEFPNFCARE
jgi:hypothetical protein